MSSRTTAARSAEPKGIALTRLALGATIGASLGGFMFGYDTAVINGSVDAMKAEFGIGSALVGTIVAAALFGAAVGAYLAGALADKFGRKNAMLAAGIIFALTSVLSGYAGDGVSLAIWRFLGGLGVGVVSVVAPLYIAEIAPARLRGRLASAQQMSIVLGIFAALATNAALAGVAGGAAGVLWWALPAWRWMFLSAAVPSIVYALFAAALPESPRYLVMRGKEPAAADTLVRLQHLSAGESQAAVAEIRGTMNEQLPSWSHLFTGPGRLRPIVWLGIALAALQALVGIDVIFYYSTSLWASVGFGEDLAFQLSAMTSLINVVSTIVAILLIDRVGRRILLLIGSVGMAVSLSVMALGFANAVPTDGGVQFAQGEAWGVLTLVAANLFVVAFAVTWGPIVWVLLGEMFPNLIRARAAAVAAGANWVAGIVVNLTFPTLRDISLAGSYALYALFSAISFFVVFYALKETNNRPLEEMTDQVASHPGKQ